MHDQTAAVSQGYHRIRIVSVRLPLATPVERTLRSTIHVEPGHKFQSKARIEVWTGDAWSEIHSEPGEALPWSGQVVNSFSIDQFLDAIVAKLERIAKDVLL